MKIDPRIQSLRNSLLLRFRRLNSTEADDMCQHALAKWVESPHWSRMESDQLGRLLYVIGLNYLRNVIKKQRRTTSRGLDFDALSVHCPKVADAETTTECIHALTHLPETQREVITRVVLDGQTFEQAALEMNKPLGSVKTWKRRGLARLRVYLSRDFEK